MKHLHRQARIAVLSVLSMVVVISVVKLSFATGNVSKGDLAGNWQITLGGVTGCGQSTELADVTLNASGSGTATLKTHGACGDSSLTGQAFTIMSLNANGSGTAGLACGTGCGWLFSIQVSPDRSTFNLVDVTDPGNFLEGSAIHQ
jgi:hypothetical protein